MKIVLMTIILAGSSLVFAKPVGNLNGIPLTTPHVQEYVMDVPVSSKIVSTAIKNQQIVATFNSTTIQLMENPFFYTIEWTDLQKFAQFNHANRLMVYTYNKPVGVSPEDLKSYLDANESRLAGSVSTTVTEFVGKVSGPQSGKSVNFCARYQLEDVEFAPDATVFPKRLGEFQDAPFASSSIKILAKLPASSCK